jgi:hypothetical protein
LSSTSSLYSANKTPVETKPPTITKIQVARDDLERLQRFIESNRTGPEAKYNMERKFVGLCASWGGSPEFILTKYYNGLKLIEKYCDKCLEQRDNNLRRDIEIKSKVQVVE